MRYKNIVLSVLQTPLQDLTTPHRIIRMRKIKALWKNTRNVVQRTPWYFYDIIMLTNNFRMIRDVQAFLNEPPELRQQTKNVIAELKPLIKRLKHHRETIYEVLVYYRASIQH